jgi:hypothetical protein
MNNSLWAGVAARFGGIGDIVLRKTQLPRYGQRVRRAVSMQGYFKRVLSAKSAYRGIQDRTRTTGERIPLIKNA